MITPNSHKISAEPFRTAFYCPYRIAGEHFSCNRHAGRRRKRRRKLIETGTRRIAVTARHLRYRRSVSRIGRYMEKADFPAIGQQMPRHAGSVNACLAKIDGHDNLAW